MKEIPMPSIAYLGLMVRYWILAFDCFKFSFDLWNEFSKSDQVVRLVRIGFPGKNRALFLSYEFQMLKSLKFILKQGLNPRTNIVLVLKDKREIPLFPPQVLLNPSKLEKKAIELSKFLNLPLESSII